MTALDNLVRIGKLKLLPANRGEFEHLLGLARTLLDTVTSSNGMATESQFILAYDSAHAASRAALRAHGYRSDDRYLVFQCLEHTIGWPTEKWRVLDTCHRRRNAAEYEGNIDLPASLTAELVRLTAELIETVSLLDRLLPST
ncbi:hypothetical protein DF020_16145 [Burkholderia cenocepacia]|uniref:hypothetical protein n=1 Tax=Burkholderia cenocepacia TaxID=95486 RepID=UPI000F5AAF37|nr:hypothetical protein [Burkholderia cenocepacia]MBR8509554.1 hypothetical protein [Burkholderia cenocepacia]RQV57282.1 hypothetical protein DF020_16145 [Burkholderia cenocepacia]